MIVCLAWGSLIWDPRELPLASEWRHDGPMLPIEFARQSSDGRITLVVTPAAKEIKVLSANLRIKNLDEAREKLAAREGISLKYMSRSVGHWSPNSSSDHEHSDAIGRWAAASDLDGVVWTALKPKFEDSYQTPTESQVIEYLKALKGETAAKAEEYVRRTPHQVQTTYRDKIEKELNWLPSS